MQNRPDENCLHVRTRHLLSRKAWRAYTSWYL